MTVRAIVIDDEPPARRRIERLLTDMGGVSVVASVSGVAKAMEALTEVEADVAFVDIQMPGQDGFTFPEQVHRMPVVFVTGYAEFAVRAFAVEALDYLLKPVEPVRLAQTLLRVRNYVREKRRGDLLPEARTSSETEVVCLPLTSGARFVKLQEIVCVLAQDDYTEVVIEGANSELVGITMKSWEERLPSERFLRVHRGAIVARERIQKLSRASGRWLLSVDGHSEEVSVSRESARVLRLEGGL